MENQSFSSANIDDYRNFDFRDLGDNEIEVSEQNYRSFPLSIITNKDGYLLVKVIIEVYKWDYWIRNFSINKFKKAFSQAFTDLNLDEIVEITVGDIEENEGDEYLVLSWNLKFPAPRWQTEVKVSILNSVEFVLYKIRLQLEGNRILGGFRKFFLIDGKSYTIGVGTFWIALPIICTFAFFLGTIKYDSDKIKLDEENKKLKDERITLIKESTQDSIKYSKQKRDTIFIQKDSVSIKP